MTAVMRPFCVAVLGGLVVSAGAAVNHAQPTAPLAGARVGHIGIAVRNVDASSRAFSQIFGVAASSPATLTVDTPTGKATLMRVQIHTATLQIDLVQPVGT